MSDDGQEAMQESPDEQQQDQDAPEDSRDYGDESREYGEDSQAYDDESREEQGGDVHATEGDDGEREMNDESSLQDQQDSQEEDQAEVDQQASGNSDFRESPDNDTSNADFLGADDQTAAAAIKIQSIQRGIRDRSKVKSLKDKGELPAQTRASKSKPGVIRESVKSYGEVAFFDGIGSKYVGQLLDGLPHGNGRYTFANGTVYEGEFAAGQFEGKGHYIFEGIGKVEATFVNGRAVGEALTFDDGLQYVPQGWKYCVEGDRRFYHEVVDPRFGLTD